MERYPLIGPALSPSTPMASKIVQLAGSHQAGQGAAESSARHVPEIGCRGGRPAWPDRAPRINYIDERLAMRGKQAIQAAHISRRLTVCRR